MNNDIDVKICKCGTIHVIQSEKYINAIENNKNYLEICKNCGATTVIGTFTELDEDGTEMKTLYDIELPDDRCSITVEDFNLSNSKKPFSEIYFSHGYRVPMMSGGYATGFKNNSFYENYPMKTRSNVLTQCVDMDRLIKEIPDEMLDAFSRLNISGIDWTGTKYYNTESLEDDPYMAPYECNQYRVDIRPEDYSSIVNYGTKNKEMCTIIN